MHKRPHSHAVHPVSERLLLARFLEDRQFLLRGLQRWEVVEQIAHERQVQLGVSLDDVLDAYKLAALHLLRVLQDKLGEFGRIGLAHVRLIDSKADRGDLK